MPGRDTIASLLARTHAQPVDYGAILKNAADQKGAQIRADEKEAQLQLERDQERAFREAEAARQQANWEKSFSLQQAAEDRAKTEQAAKEATRQAYGKFGELLASPNQTQAQVQALTGQSPTGKYTNKLLAEAQAIMDKYTPTVQNPDGSWQAKTMSTADNARFNVLQEQLNSLVNKDLDTNKGSLTQQRQLLLEQAPVKELYDTIKDPVTGQEVLRTRGDLDTAQQQALKESMLGNLDRRIDAEAARAQALQLHRESEAAAKERFRQELALKAKEKEEQQKQLTAMMKLYAPKEVGIVKQEPKMIESITRGLNQERNQAIAELNKVVPKTVFGIKNSNYDKELSRINAAYDAKIQRILPARTYTGKTEYKEASPADMLTRINEVLRPGSGATAAEQVMAIKLAEELRTLAAEKEAGLTKADSDFRLFKAQEDYKAKLKKEEDD